MANLSFTIVDGNLVQDPEMRTIGENQKVTQFVLAVNHGDKNQSVSFFPVEIWGKNAENCKNFLKKGSKVTVVGNLRQDRWKDNEGKYHSRIKIIAQTVRFDRKSKKKKINQEAA